MVGLINDCLVLLFQDFLHSNKNVFVVTQRRAYE